MFAICASLSYGQFKVTSDGVNHALNPVLVVGENTTSGAAFVKVGVGRPAAGSAAFDFVSDVGAFPVFGLRLLRNVSGTSRFSHRGTNPLQFATNDAGNIQFLTNNSVRMTVNAGGGVDIAGAATVNGGVTVTSDERTKKSINDFSLGLDEVLQLRPISYEYNGFANTNPNGRKFVGLVAQELQKVAPQFVSNHISSEYNDDGDVIGSTEVLKIHDTELKYLLVNAIKDQQKMIEDQAVRIADLEESISTIGSVESINNTNITLSSYDLAELDQNTPNPFNGQTTISYVIPTDAQNAQIMVYGQSGQLMKSLDIDHVGQGTLTVDAQDLPSGTYSYQLVVDGRNIQLNKMMVITK